MVNFTKFVFYSNIYLGLAAIALCIETNLLSGISLNVFPFYLIIFLCTCIYYTMIYVRSVGAKNYTERTLWYRANLKAIKGTLNLSLCILIFLLAILLVKNIHYVVSLSILKLTLLFIIPLIAGLYTFTPTFLPFKKIRQIGWLKPFIVGLTWSGMVTIFPLIIWQVQRGQFELGHYYSSFLLWLQNFLFISAMALLFDMSDYRNDARRKLNTYPVLLGIRKTIKMVLIPLLLINVVVFLLYQYQQQFSVLQTIVRSIPYLLLFYIVGQYRQQRKLLYYLAAVDGLLFVKAFCGIVSIIYLKQ